MGVKGMIKRLGELPRIINYDAELQSMRGNYEKWLFWQEHAQDVQEDLEHEEGLPVTTEGYFGNRSLFAMQSYFARHPQVLILYGDEDARQKDGTLSHPWFRPDWSPERLENCFYLGSLIAFRKTFLAKYADWKEILGPFQVSEVESEAEGRSKKNEEYALIFANETPDEAYREMVRTLCERAGGWERGRGSIAHLPGILYHCSSLERFLAFADPATGHRRMQDPPADLLSVIVLTKDHPELMENCLKALKRAYGIPAEGPESVEHPGLEVIIVDNGSTKENRERLEKIPDVTYLYEPMEFNFSRMCNLGAERAMGKYLLFLNDDVELLPESRLDQMMMLAARPGVGSVGLKLFYPDSTLIQHVGITNLPTGPVHKLLFLDDREEHYFGRNRGWWNVLAVSAACVMIRAEVFWEAGGFYEELAVAYNDVALGFRLYELGYRNVVTCDAFAYHHESLTRGSDADEKKRERLLVEQKRLYQRFPELKNVDPYFSDYLSRQSTDTRIRPAYETMNNVLQIVTPMPIGEIEGIRMDPCLKVCVEEDRGGEMLGYAVVLGDDNACYERFLILERESGERYKIKLHEQYRPDLEEKMTDQQRVALSGFWICLTKGTLPPGRYRVGCLAKRKVGSLKLFYWSGSEIKIKE